MAKIPLYQQERLASSRVGVPELDTSGLTTAKSLLGGTEALANTQTSATGKLIGESAAGMDQGISESSVLLFHRQAQMRIAETALTELQNKTAISSLSTPMSYTLEDLTKEAKDANPDDPKAAAKYFQDRFPQKRDEAISQMGLENRPQVAAGILAHANTKAAEHYKELVDYGFTQGNIVEEKRTVASAKQSIERAGQGEPLDPKTIGAAITNIGGLRDAINNNARTPGEGEEKVREYKQKALIGWITNGINNDPQKTKILLDSAVDNFNGLLDPTQLKALRTASETNIAKADAVLEKQQTHAAIDIDHQIIDIKNSANVDLYINADKSQLNPDFISKSQDALTKLRGLYQQVDQQPKNKQTLGVLKTIDAAINTTQTQINQFMTATASQATADAKEHKAQLAAEKKAAVEHYDSPAAVSARTNLDEALDSVKGLNKRKNTREQLSDSELFSRVQNATELMKKAHDDGFITKPGAGQDDKYYSTQSAYLKAINERLVQNASKPSFIEDHFAGLSDGPPDLVMHAKNPDGDPKIAQQVKGEYANELHKGSDRWKDQHGKAPTKDQIVKYIRPNAIRIYLGLPIPNGGE